MKLLESILNNTAAFIAALAALIVAIANLVKAIFEILRDYRDRSQESALSNRPQSIIKNKNMLIGLLLMMVPLSVFGGRLLVEEAQYNKLPIHAQLTVKAWKALDKGNYSKVIEKTDGCINQFGTQAEREQKSLTQDGTPQPRNSGFTEDEKRLTLSRGVLNDVATCYFIKGQALEKLDRVNDAKEAYKKAQDFPHARTWDPNGWFWSPAEASSDRLTKLQ